MARDRFRYFRIEARDLLDQLGQGVLDLEKDAPPPDLVARLLRLAHTLKGAARVVKQPEIADLAHNIEDGLAVIRETPRAMTRAEIDTLLAHLDGISTRVAALSVPVASTPDAMALAGTAATASLETEELFRAFRPDVHEMDGLLDALAEAQSQLTSLGPIVGRVERLRHHADLVLDHLASPIASDSRASDRSESQARALADDLRTMCGTIERDLTHRVTQITREFHEARGAAERLRLVPANALFTLLERTARDAAQALGKRVIFEGRGGGVRIDPQVLAIVQSALVQMVRNAVAHGIESAAERTTAGKPADGLVILEVSRRGHRAVFSCQDDGRGVNLKAIKQLAEQKGLTDAEAPVTDSTELFRLLLKGGISTSGTVTGVSGRGVGLDVVREAADRLGGDVTVQTTEGAGTTISVIVPLTLASIESLLVETAGTTAVLPLDAVRGSVRLSTDAIVRTAAGQSIVYDGQHLPLGALALALVPGHAATRETHDASVVVVQGSGGRAAFEVDRVLGTASSVLRRLPELAPAAPYIAGVSLDDDGVPRPVLDPDALVNAASRALAARDQPRSVRPHVLVIDDSLTTRMLEQSILESAGYIVDLATSGEEGLEKARARRYALFLVDVEMPGMDGFTFIERIKMDQELRDIPAILVTSRSSPEDQRRGKAVGARGYIVKGEFDQGVLLERIRGLVG
jgi:two-component system, chemotaxis family, sensor kinase CheA